MSCGINENNDSVIKIYDRATEPEQMVEITNQDDKSRIMDIFETQNKSVLEEVIDIDPKAGIVVEIDSNEYYVFDMSLIESPYFKSNLDALAYSLSQSDYSYILSLLE